MSHRGTETNRAGSISVPETQTERIAWPDFARGICVTLVVAMHIYEVHYMVWLADAPLSGAWDALVSAAQPIRMPLFFLISGYLCANSIRRPWGKVARKRVFSIAYLYYLWLGLYAFTSLWETALKGISFSPELFIKQLLWPATSLWYLYGLVIYFIIARMTTRIPLWILGTGLALLSILGTSFLEGTLQYLTRCLLFFILGCRAPHAIFAVAARAKWVTTAITFCFYGLLCGFALWVGQETLGVVMMASIAGIYLALQGSALVGPWKASGPVKFIGKNTLPIFVLHPILLKGLNLIFETNPSIEAWIYSHPFLAVSYPALITVVTLIACLLLERLAKQCYGNFLFELPSRAR